MVSLTHAMLEKANGLLLPLGRDFVFIGGSIVHLYIDDPAAAPVRTTKDVDIVVAAVTYAEFSQVEEDLRRNGFEQILAGDAPICRWSKDGLLLDVIPTKPQILGFSESHWFEAGFANAVPVTLANGKVIDVFDLLHLLAAKIEAFNDRGGGDQFASQDFEDIASLLDGNLEVFQHLKGGSEVARFVADWLVRLRNESEEFEDAFIGHVGSVTRAITLMQQIAGLR